MSYIYNNKVNRAIVRNQIFSMGVGATFTAGTIKELLLAKGVDMDSHVTTAVLRREKDKHVKVISKNRRKGCEYMIISVPKSMRNVDTVQIQ